MTKSGESFSFVAVFVKHASFFSLFFQEADAQRIEAFSATLASWTRCYASCAERRGRYIAGAPMARWVINAILHSLECLPLQNLCYTLH